MRGNVFGIADKLQDVPLGDSHVLDYLPKTVWHVERFAIDMFEGEIGDDFVEAHVSISSPQERGKFVAEHFL